MSNVPDSEGKFIKMAQIGVLQTQGKLRTLLGSCVGIALFDKKLKLIGLAHVVMPCSMGTSDSPGKYADTAIPEMIRRMNKLACGSKLFLTAKIAGGANMFSYTTASPSATIGEQNILAVEESLAKEQIPVLGRHLGGSFGRRMVVDAESGIAHIHVVGYATVQF
ncbi:Chemoreceptor glutamine deamidase CheD [Pirellula sp. SH-Sr6A]|uniref:chemotaxis protein CheD n=1 Tax=Pirellula sp. SH-Sr6A TaxID=1632865 RepID=UPI00078B53A9|nr:chemotaxis protein CheD [Pirellula sp. SH-Sr6A]AMV35411.1 Chemoreceptor glutamine deamidase CheD [Pirellula sp. SH-Sr6A]